MNIFHQIKNSAVIDLSRLCSRFLPAWSSLSIDSQNWLLSGGQLVGIADLRARIGSAPNPWSAKTSVLWAPPPLKFINASLADIADQRAIEILKIAKDTNKKIALMWSGGIDSTFLVTAFLKNLNQSDHELLTIYCNSTSLIENFDYYFNCIRLYKNVHLKSSSTCIVDNNFLNQNILLHGDPADCLFGPSTPMYKKHFNNGEQSEPWKKHSKKMIDLLELSVSPKFRSQNWGNWYFNYITKNLEESGQADYVSSVADWWWWTYFNFKWEFSTTRFFHRPKIEHVDGISLKNQQEFANYTFFHSSDFQLWSYSNLKTLTEKNIAQTHKIKARQYINEFYRNDLYFSTKRKMPSQTPTIPNSRTTTIGYNNEYRPIFINNKKDHDVVLTLLSKWKAR